MGHGHTLTPSLEPQEALERRYAAPEPQGSREPRKPVWDGHRSPRYDAVAGGPCEWCGRPCVGYICHYCGGDGTECYCYPCELNRVLMVGDPRYTCKKCGRGFDARHPEFTSTEEGKCYWCRKLGAGGTTTTAPGLVTGIDTTEIDRQLARLGPAPKPVPQESALARLLRYAENVFDVVDPATAEFERRLKEKRMREIEKALGATVVRY